MTYRPDEPGPPGPQYPFSYGPAAPRQTSKMATWSIVFAFVFAPLGAVLGHFALADIRDLNQGGRNRAVLGLTLSYAVTVIAVGALVVWAIRPANPVSSMASRPEQSPSHTSESPTPTTNPPPTTPALSQADLRQMLLTADEIKAITKTPDLTLGASNSGDGPVPGAPSATPSAAPPCSDVINAGTDSEFTGTGYLAYEAAHFIDTTEATVVEEVVSSFPDAAAAQRFIGHVADFWSGCSGQTVTVPDTSPPIAVVVGNVTATTDGATVQNTLVGKSFTQYRSLAMKGNVVVNLGAMGFHLTPDQPQAMQDQILARIPG